MIYYVDDDGYLMCDRDDGSTHDLPPAVAAEELNRLEKRVLELESALRRAESARTSPATPADRQETDT